MDWQSDDGPNSCPYIRACMRAVTWLGDLHAHSDTAEVYASSPGGADGGYAGAHAQTWSSHLYAGAHAQTRSSHLYAGAHAQTRSSHLPASQVPAGGAKRVRGPLGTLCCERVR